MTNQSTKRPANPKAAAGTRTTKKDQLVKLLSTTAGVDIKSLSEKLGWQPHTTRAAMSGLRKAGYEIAGDKPAKGGKSKYRILSGPMAQESALVGSANGA